MQALILSLGYVVDVLNTSKVNRFQFGKSRVVQRLQRYSVKPSNSTVNTRSTRKMFARTELFPSGHPTTPRVHYLGMPGNFNALPDAVRKLDQKLMQTSHLTTEWETHPSPP